MPGSFDLDPSHRVVPIDSGSVCVDYDKQWFTDHGMTPPATFDDLADPRFKDLLVIESPVASTPGQVFLAATHARFGAATDDYWRRLRANGVAVAMSGYTGPALAVKLGGEGDITKDRLWQQPKAIQRVGSGLIHEGHVYIVEENGVPHCYNLDSGEEVWKVEQRPGGGDTWGSMILAEGRLYVLMRNGTTLVFAASPKYELLATNTLERGESTNASLAVSNGEVFIRTFKNLWCISANK